LTSPQPRHIEDYYTSYFGGRHGFTKEFRSHRRAALVRRVLPPGDDAGRLIDVGCGDGSFLETMERFGLETLGTELSATAAQRPNVFADLDQIRDTFGEASVDVITMWHSLEHFHDPVAILRSARELLRPGASLLIAVPNADSLQARVAGQHWLHLDVPRHLNHFGARSLERALRTAGFTMDSTAHLEVEYDILGWSQSTLNKIFREPNVFFHLLIGQPTQVGRVAASANFTLGSLFAALSLPLVAAGAVLGRGSSLIVVARPSNFE
jgi:2-polyprenyl-3-methyl-5-hydroxy-6-metoxy-1,4-benzoquinol methylase